MGYDEFERLCKLRGVTAYQVAKETGVSTSTISSWKVGRYIPKTEKLNKLAEYFSVPVELFTDQKMGKTSIVPADGQPGWYIDPETARVAQELLENPDTRMLFDAARDAKPENIRFAAEMLKRFKETNPDG